LSRSLSALLVAGAIAGFAAGANEQSHPDFSGRWIVDAAKMGKGRAGAPITITQDAVSLILIRENGYKIVYRLDGKEVVNKTPVLGPTAVLNPRMNLPDPGTDETYKSQWGASSLVTTMTGRGANGPTMATEVRSLVGEWMVDETTRKTPAGDVTHTTYWKRHKGFNQ
jgi:hypothetical protein